MRNEADKNSSLAEELWNALESADGRNEINEGRKLRQKKVLQNLPKDFAMEMRAVSHMAGPNDTSNGALRGELFESLVRADTEICPSVETETAKLLRSIMHDPAIYGLKDQGIDDSFINADVANIDEAELVINGTVEVKVSRIKSHGAKQLLRSKVEFATLLNRLRTIKPKLLETHGLKKISDNIQRIKFSLNYTTSLAVPFGIYDGTIGSLLDDRIEPGYRSHLEGKLKDLDVKVSPFSRDELNTMIGKINRWLDTRRTSQTPR